MAKVNKHVYAGWILGSEGGCFIIGPEFGEVFGLVETLRVAFWKENRTNKQTRLQQSEQSAYCLFVRFSTVALPKWTK